MTTREKAAIGLWVLFVVGAVGLAIVVTPLWFAVAGIAAAGLWFWGRQLLSASD